jgi:hypothetical protein
MAASSYINFDQNLTSSFSSFYVNELLSHAKKIPSGSRGQISVDFNSVDRVKIDGEGAIYFPWIKIAGSVEVDFFKLHRSIQFFNNSNNTVLLLMVDYLDIHAILGNFRKLPIYFRIGKGSIPFGHHASEIILNRHMVTRVVNPAFNITIGGDYVFNAHSKFSGTCYAPLFQLSQIPHYVLNVQYQQSNPFQIANFKINRWIIGGGGNIKSKRLRNFYTDIIFNKFHNFKFEYTYAKYKGPKNFYIEGSKRLTSSLPITIACIYEKGIKTLNNGLSNEINYSNRFLVATKVEPWKKRVQLVGGLGWDFRHNTLSGLLRLGFSKRF